MPAFSRDPEAVAWPAEEVVDASLYPAVEFESVAPLLLDEELN